jgi:hypothetical protein
MQSKLKYIQSKGRTVYVTIELLVSPARHILNSDHHRYHRYHGLAAGAEAAAAAAAAAERGGAAGAARPEPADADGAPARRPGCAADLDYQARLMLRRRVFRPCTRPMPPSATRFFDLAKRPAYLEPLRTEIAAVAGSRRRRGRRCCRCCRYH